MSYEVLLRNLGFDQDPFASWDADEEERLQRYFIKPPFFDAVYGERAKPSASVVFAARGGGKSALRRMVELASPTDEIICVTYTSFPTAGKRLADIDLAYHLRNVIVLVLIGIVGHLLDEKRYLNLSPGSRKALYWLIKEHLSALEEADLRAGVQAVRAMSDKARAWWNNSIKIATPIFATITMALGIPAPDLTLFENDRLDLGPLSDQLAFLSAIAFEGGASAIFVLVDRVDENDLTGNEATKAFTLISPLLKNLNVLQTAGFGFKFFLWDLLRDSFRRDCRPDRIKTYDLEWVESQIREMLASRLAAYSDERHKTLASLVEFDGVGDVDALSAFLANGSPRNVIRMLQEILTQQSEMNPNASKLSLAAFKAGVQTFARKYSEEQVPAKMLRELQKVGRIDFTVSFLYNDVFKISQQSGLNKIQTWGNRGIVKQLGQQKTVSGSQSNHYVVVDPIIAMYVSNIDVFEFMKKKVRICPKCASRNTRDWDITGIQECGKCQRDLNSGSEGLSA